MHWRIHKITQEKHEIEKLIDHLYIEAEAIIKDQDQLELFKQYIGEVDFFFAECKSCYTVEQINKIFKISERYIELSYWKSYKTKYANNLKEKLKEVMAASLERNKVNDHKCVRKLRDEAIIDKNIISVFESSLTRMLEIKKNELSTDIMVIKVYYFDIIQDLILHGFEYNGERYKFFTASAGQIRTKKTVFIKESLWDKYERTLMCGLTVDGINSQGGINVNKFLAYLALSNSATDLWEGFDIDRCIVVPDFETTVNGLVDFIDDVSYTVERKNMDIAIEHTDGCGMMLPSVSGKNFMVRLPWIKGLLASFDYMKFIETYNCDPIIEDIYGQKHNIIEEDIQIIFTKSQFKMHKYYSSWDEYKTYFKKYNCQAGTCKEEEDYIRPAHINYQMLQTLTELTDDEIVKIITPAMDALSNLTSRVSVMLDAFGVSRKRTDLNPFQEALLIYPEMLNETYCRETLKSIKKSLVKQYRAGKLPIKGKFTFVIPDLFAVCENLFLHIDNPNGLLNDGEVSCRLYKQAKRLDCLRSPHLYKEHAIRNNILNEQTAEWFDTDAIYTSCKDLISKVLQFDCDGDFLLVIADSIIINAAERSMKDIVPLYYDMKKAEPVILNREEYYKGMTAAWTGGNIGVISNDITKIWNSKENIGEDELLAVKLLCMENNFTIDYAKTLYKPKRPAHINKFISKYTRTKMPNFFMYAKDYTAEQVTPVNNSIVNKLEKFIKNKRLSFKNFALFNYRKLMDNPSITVDENLISDYLKFIKEYHFKVNSPLDDRDNMPYLKMLLKNQLLKHGYSEYEITDMLIKYLYGHVDSKYKNVLWLCYGDIIVKNLKRNIDSHEAVCMHCGRRFKRKAPNHRFCDRCALERKKTDDEIIRICKDCGHEFIVNKLVHHKSRCDKCQAVAKREFARLRKQKSRAKQKQMGKENGEIDK